MREPITKAEQFQANTPSDRSATPQTLDDPPQLRDAATPATKCESDGSQEPVTRDPGTLTAVDRSCAETLPGGRYRLGDEIARGGMGVVYRAVDTVLDRDVAVKVLLHKFAAAGSAAQRFIEEARVTGQLQHPAIPAVYDLGTLPDGRPFLAMKLIKGSTLADLLKERPSPDHERGRFIAIFEQICQAVAFAHEHHVLHRDLKPGNVMVGRFGEVQVMDWGLAKVVQKTDQTENLPVEQVETEGTDIRTGRVSNLLETEEGAVLGTLPFMAPEQAAGEIARIDERSDVFGLGAILAVILTGEMVYRSRDRDSIHLMAVRGQTGDCLERLDRSGGDPDLVALCKRCLAFTPAERPQNAGELAARWPRCGPRRSSEPGRRNWSR